jgi:ubiquinone biosynthesis UbiH/UbiF/VisC/COQ6 family hydroxylase
LDADLIIAGAGPAGLSLAVALADTRLRILLLDRAAREALAEPRPDGREIALTRASIQHLRRLGVWDRIARSDIAPLTRARVLNGHSPFTLDFDSRRADEPLGVLVPNAAIRRALFEAVHAQQNCTLIADCAVTSLDTQPGYVAAVAGARRFSAGLAVAADTRFSPLRQLQGISARMTDFARSMLICRMVHSVSHRGIATEWFGHGQTVAMLPLDEGVSSYLLTLPPHEIRSLMEMTEEEFAADATRRTHARWGAMRLQSARHVYPLVAVYADRFVAARFALLGDAAVGMHPVTAHGYNFGLLGAVTLAGELSRAAARGGDIGAPEGLLRYERQHRSATWPLYVATNSLAKLYTDDRPLPRFARALGLRFMWAATPARRLLEAHLSA